MLIAAHSQRVDRIALARIPKPQAIGPRHKPVAHIELIEMLEARFKAKLNATVEHEEFAVRRGSSTLFGVMSLSYGAKSDASAAIGFRHANDMSLSIQLVAGMSVFVCNNMVLRGDVIILREKHTFDLSLADSIDLGIDRFVAQYAKLENETNSLRDTHLSDAEVKSFVLDAFVKSHIMPIKFIDRVYREYFKPTKPEFEPRTGWSLHNAFTQIAKNMPLTTRISAIQHLGKLMGLETM